jgi:hypothetical protein
VAEVTGARRSVVEPSDQTEELAEVLRRVNRIRVDHGVDPLYELPRAAPAMTPGSTCVLQEAFFDIGVATVDYHELVGRGIRIEHGLGWFIRRFDDGAYPQLAASPHRLADI